MKAIETVYNGYRFRSRLEARWAYCLDLIGWKWEYEPEGYDLGEAGWYLPDFLLRAHRDGEGYKEGDQMLWIEVKPKTPTEEEKHKLRRLAFETRIPAIFAIGLPDYYSLQVGMDGYHRPKEENIDHDWLGIGTDEEPVSSWVPKLIDGCHETSLSISTYCIRKWGRPGWVMGEGYLDAEDADVEICEMVKAIRFEHGENKLPRRSFQAPPNLVSCAPKQP